MAIHCEYTLDISDIPLEAIKDCSSIGDVSEAVEYWVHFLEFTVDRDNALSCLKGYGAWEESELAGFTDKEIATKIFFLACGNFNDYIVECERANVNPFNNNGFESNCGSDIFVLE